MREAQKTSISSDVSLHIAVVISNVILNAFSKFLQAATNQASDRFQDVIHFLGDSTSIVHTPLHSFTFLGHSCHPSKAKLELMLFTFFRQGSSSTSRPHLLLMAIWQYSNDNCFWLLI